MSGRIAVDQLRRGRTRADTDILQLSETVVPIPGASMRILEVLVATAALGVAILLGLAR